MLIKEVHQKIVIFVTIGILKIIYHFKDKTYLCNGCRELKEKTDTMICLKQKNKEL